MSLREKLTESLKDNPNVTTVVVRDGSMHGERGRFIKVFGHAVWIEIFIADSRKVKDSHAMTIVHSYLRNANLEKNPKETGEQK
jgi:hypothetical protein